jgi:hypothetical protein
MDSSIVEITMEQITLFIRCVMNNYIQDLLKCIEGIKDLILYIKSLTKSDRKLQKNLLSIGYILILFRPQQEPFDYSGSLKTYLDTKYPNEKILLDEVFLDCLCRFVKLVKVDKIVSEMIQSSRSDYEQILSHLCIK